VDVEGAWLEDVGSTNGTSVNGSPLPVGERRRVYDGDTLKLGSVTVKLLWPEGGTPAPGTSEAGEVSGAPPVEAAMGRLVAEDGGEFLLLPGVTTLGRRSENKIVLSGDAYISGRHAEIRCDSGGCVLVDVGSTNGTFLRRGTNDEDWERLKPHDPQTLSEGDVLRLGQTVFTFQFVVTEGEAESGDEAPGDGEAAAELNGESEPMEQSQDGG
jgi:pSer/pThr/pTyr-binding forkhead associated (FHA) protein